MGRKASVKYVCSSCGALASNWTGRCNACGEWNTLQEQLEISASSAAGSGRSLKPTAIDAAVKVKLQRYSTTMGDVDIVLGGGLVPGSVCLLAGQPGIGKSTLLLQLAANLAQKQSVLYVSGEESAEQIGLRAQRLKTKAASLQLATSSSANDVAATIAGGSFNVVIVDSIQTLSLEEISSGAGSVSQITNSAQLLTAAAKSTQTALIMVGHVTKEGSIAGPKVLEHAVDVVLQLDGDRYGGFKMLRVVKNRFGSTNEAAIFEMQDDGLRIVENPSEALLKERQVTDGSVVLATLEGSRALLVEIQALVNPTSYGYPKRTASGIDLNRVNLLIAMLERRTKLKLADKDIYLNVVGGIRLDDPAADLAICMAIASAAKGMQLKKHAVVFGEVGLSGEVRHVQLIDKRIAEAKKMGFEVAIGPRVLRGKAPTLLHIVSDVRSALNTFLEKD